MEPIIYNFILIGIDDKEYLGWSRAEKIPPCGEPDLLEWVEWKKELPDDIEDGYIYKNKTLVKEN